jgi:pSer/pThr/pTyr-binding forkhead associated (FHA) protein
MAKLIVTDDDRTVLVDLRPGEGVRLGRARDTDVPLAAPRASRHHAAVVPVGHGHAVRDLGSTNGTRLNGFLLDREMPLADGDVLDVGGARVVYRSRP